MRNSTHDDMVELLDGTTLKLHTSRLNDLMAYDLSHRYLGIRIPRVHVNHFSD